MSNRKRREKFHMPPAESYRPVTPEIMMDGLSQPCSVNNDQELRNATCLALVLATDREVERGHLAEIVMEGMRLSFYMGQLRAVTSAGEAYERGLLDKEMLKVNLDVVSALAETARVAILNKMELVVQCAENPSEVN